MKDKYQIDARLSRLYDSLDDVGGEDPIIQGKLDALDWVSGDADNLISGEVDAGFKEEARITTMIEELIKEKETLPEYSFFGDSNWKLIDAQVEILKWILKETP